MTFPRWASIGVLVVLLSVAGVPRPTSAFGATVSGNGQVRAAAAGAAFIVQLDDSHPLVFDYFDYGSDPVRTFVLYDGAQVDCLGQLFGGQTIRLTGNGSDSAAPAEATSIQVFLVDGGGAGPDRISIKARRMDGRVVYFLPIRDLDSGDLSVACSG